MMKRERADRVIAAMLEAAAAINADPRMMHWVTRLSVFGSYLTDKPVLGDLDVAFELKGRWRGKEDAGYNEMRKRFLMDFPPPDSIASDFMARLFWPGQVVVRRLRVGRNISFHEHSELALLECPSRLLFEFAPEEVVLA